ncbi:hypothetical protein KEM60_01752 [Austwickia sp. TVS 96-490-7B]|uniref:ABC-2 family transporter protein n=1 Tax=Austwickia sp. TVS 96-490-7B TaxID=2830843 RepID=UPI001C56DCEC|nr:ABC-2 family transporter protein [Austwickia sp. TVS 96-490-7B]MBW3085552.1 hypothetical protein [Austwickia sp. TVS 96-490-7B]
MWWITTYRLDLKTQASYRLDFAIQIIIWVLYASLPLLVVGVMVEKFPNSGMNISQVALLYCAVQIGYETSRMLERALDDFHTETSKGHLDRLLVRPRALLPMIISSRIFPRRIAGITAGLAGGVIGMSGRENIEDALFLLIVAIISSGLVFSGLLTIYAASCFLTVTRNMFADVVTGSLVTLSLAPIENFATPLQFLVSYVIPIRTTLQSPIRSIDDGVAFQLFADVIIPIASAAAFYAFSVAIFQYCRRFYQSPGA